MVLLGLLAGWAISRVSQGGYRMDANVRLIQNVLVGAQQTAITRNTAVQVMFDASVVGSHRLRVLLDADDDGQASVNESMSFRPLIGASFLTPPAQIDAALPGYVTGPGLLASRPALQQAIRVAPNGALSGDVVLYLGSAANRPLEARAVFINGATGRTAFWSYATGSWVQRDY